MKGVIPLAMVSLTVGALTSTANPAQSNPVASIQEVVSQPAFQRPPGQSEAIAKQGSPLQNKTRLRTATPGRMQIRFNKGNRSFRMGGNASLQLNGNTIDHRGGQVIAWIAPGGGLRTPLKIRTRIATAAIRGTTLFIDDREDKIIFLSWEGEVGVKANSGDVFTVSSGEVLTYDDASGTWIGPVPLTRKQAMTRRRKSQLLNGFQAPMETMPEVEDVLNKAPVNPKP